jgi:hypothetical protein
MTATDLAARESVRAPDTPIGFSLEDRLNHGNLTVKEVRRLKNRSHSGFYEDVKAGLVKIEKIGRKSIVRGPIARAYINGQGA